MKKSIVISISALFVFAFALVLAQTTPPLPAEDDQEIFQTECPYCHAPLNQVPTNLTTNSVTHSDVGMKTVIARTGQIHCHVCSRDFTAHNDIWIADATAKTIKMPSRKRLQMMSMPPIPAEGLTLQIRTNLSVVVPHGRSVDCEPMSKFTMAEIAEMFTTNSNGIYLLRIHP